jgi:ornithine cyclodeaminase/alanine dehydrogenase-like protein (mu-crystallin family)
MRTLTRSQVEQALPFHACMQAMREAMQRTSAGECTLPLRQFMPIPERAGKLGLMPGYLGGDADCFGVKIVSKYERPANDPHGSHVGAVMIFEAATGLPVGLLEGGALTAIRTAAMTAVATDALARNDARTLLMVGTGEEAWTHARALQYARPFTHLRLWGRSPHHAEALQERLQHWRVSQEQAGDRHFAGSTPEIEVVHDLPSACKEADVICTVTSAKTPFFQGAWLSAGTHVNLVGSAVATTAEADTEVVSRSRFFVDYRPAALAAAGELLTALNEGRVTESHIAGEIGEVLSDPRGGRQAPTDITVYKSLGVTTQDLAAALLALNYARELGIGEDLLLSE